MCSILVNVLLLAAGAAFFVVAGEHTAKLVSATDSDSAAGKIPAQATAEPVSPAPATAGLPFQWKQLDSGNDYRQFIANLRATGCPEASIADIVRGNVDRAFSWERGQLHLDGSGSGPWSLARETALINDLLGNSDAPRAALYSQNTGARSAEPLQGSPEPVAEAANTLRGQVAQVSDPQLYQNAQTPQTSSWLSRGAAWNATAGLTPTAPANQSSGGQGQQASANANGYSQQNSGSGPSLAGGSSSSFYSGSSPESSSSPGQPTVSDTAADNQSGQSASDDPYTKSAQDIMAQQQSEYYSWYEPQVEADTASGSPLVINPDDFHPVQ